MKLFKDPDSMFTFLKENYLANPRPVAISTYNMYLGISGGKDWSRRYPSTARSFMDCLDPSHTRVLLGIPPFIECKEDCPECNTRYQKLLQRFRDTKEELGLDMRFSNSLHLKMYAVGSLVVSGGINLASSDFVDVTFTIDSEHTNSMLELFNLHWHASKQEIDGVSPQPVEIV